MILAAQLALIFVTWGLALGGARPLCRWLGYDYGLVAALSLGVSGSIIALVWAGS